jgi:hypothetical protein
MLAGGYSWRLFFYVEAAFAGALLILAFIFVEETTYHRKAPTSPMPSTSPALNGAEKVLSADSRNPMVQHRESNIYVPPRKSFLSTLKPWGKIDHDAEFFMTMLRPFSYFVVPAVLWVITTYGTKQLLDMKTSTNTCFARNLYWTRCFSFQLHIPDQDCSSTIQLEGGE